MNRKVIVFFFIYLLIVWNEAYAQRRGEASIGKVNYYAVLLLHPAMINYDTEINAFYIKRDQVAEQKAKNEKKSNKEEVNKLETQIKIIRSRIREEDKKFMNKMDKMGREHNEELATLATGPAAVSEIEYRKKKDKEEKAYFSKVASLNGEISIMEEQIKKLTQYSFIDGFTTPEETYKRFEAILSETDSYIRRIAEQKGISIVLNSTYKRLLKNSNSFDNRTISNNQNLGYIVKGPIQATLNIDPMALKGYYESINERTTSWLDNAGYILNRMNANLANTDILMGGIDLTGDVLTALYKAYKIDANISNAVIQTAINY